MKLHSAAGAIALVSAAALGGCATYPDGTTRVASASANPNVVVAEGDNNAMPYTQQSFFFKDRGLHYEDPSALTPKIVSTPPAVPRT